LGGGKGTRQDEETMKRELPNWDNQACQKGSWRRGAGEGVGRSPWEKVSRRWGTNLRGQSGEKRGNAQSRGSGTSQWGKEPTRKFRELSYKRDGSTDLNTISPETPKSQKKKHTQ